MTHKDDQNIESETKSTLEDIEASLEKEISAVEEAETAMNA